MTFTVKTQVSKLPSAAQAIRTDDHTRGHDGHQSPSLQQQMVTYKLSHTERETFENLPHLTTMTKYVCRLLRYDSAESIIAFS